MGPFDWTLLQVFPVEIFDPVRHCNRGYGFALYIMYSDMRVYFLSFYYSGYSQCLCLSICDIFSAFLSLVDLLSGHFIIICFDKKVVNWACLLSE